MSFLSPDRIFLKMAGQGSGSILVDEFQDVNKIQYEILKMLALPENNLL